MPSTFHTSRRIEFADTDMAGIAHFSSFLRFLEEAEHAFLRSLGLSVIQPDESGKFSWPRVSVKCDYRGPARFEEVLDIALQVSRIGTSSITYQFQIHCQKRHVANAEMTAVYCRFDLNQPPHPVPIPKSILDLLSPFCLVAE